jgi:hypothetical protein
MVNTRATSFIWEKRDFRKYESQIVSFWCEILKQDSNDLLQGRSITLAGKWVPIQDGRFCRHMNLSHKQFRKMVRSLREKLDIVECKMSSRDWENITFEKVCSLSMKRYGNAFRKHCQERFSAYLESVKKGEKKMNVGQLYPSDIAGQFLRNESCDEEMLNVAWEQLLQKTKSSLSKSPKRFLCVVDTSGSMSGQPLDVAVSLGLFLSELNPDSRFYRKFITFSESPCLQHTTGETLKERIQSIGEADWGMNTNLQKVFSLILDESSCEDHPDVVIVLSNMQFDQAFSEHKWGSGSTNLDEIEIRYKEAGIARPRLIFWNLRADTIDFPATTSVADCALVSGFSTSLLDSLLEDGEISPMGLYRKTIDSIRYDQVYTESC